MATREKLRQMAAEIYRLANEKIDAQRDTFGPGFAQCSAMAKNDNRRWYDRMLDRIDEAIAKEQLEKTDD